MVRRYAAASRRAEILAQAAHRLNETLQLEEVLSTLCREVRLALSADAAIVWLVDGGGGLRVAAGDGSSPLEIGTRARRGDGLVGSTLSADEPRSTTSAAAVPLRRRGVPDGIVHVTWPDGHDVEPHEMELLVGFAHLASGACRNAEDHALARRAASIDSLTGALNHAAFQARLREEISRAERGAEPFTLALVDLDGFRLVNDRFGHLAGDAVLRGAGEMIRTTVRLHDQVGRFGGDEFALLLPATDPVAAQAIVDRTLEALSGLPVPGGETVSACAGLAAYAWGDEPPGVIERADGALREAKHRRGSRVIAPPPRETVDQDPGRDRPDRRTHRLAVAGELGARLSGLLDPEAIARTAVTDMAAALGFELCAVVRAEPSGGARPLACAGLGEAGMEPRPVGSPVWRCLTERRPVLVNDATRDPLYANRLPEGVRSALVVPLYAGSDLWGAVEVLSRGAAAFDPGDAQLVQTICDHVGAALLTAELYRELEQTYVGTAAALAAALEAKDDYTADHAQSIADLAVDVGREMGLDDGTLRDLRYGAIFHDIGKIAVPDAILHKPGRLTDDEFEVVKRHPVTGEQILAPVPFLADVRRIVRHDHERWDGTGYPDGLRGPQIPIGARIVLVVDAFHAMTSDRPYRRGMSEDDARRQLMEGAGTQFDPDVVAAFLRVLDRVAA